MTSRDKMIKKILCSEQVQRCFDDPNFKTDYCSGGLSYMWKKLFNKDCPYNIYCIEHDCKYFFGTKEYEGILTEIIERFKADYILAKNIWNNNQHWYDKLMAVIVFIAVRIGGSRVWIFNSFKWRYGISIYDELKNRVKDIEKEAKSIEEKFD